MTTLICWISRDPNGTSAAYLASDSRITWGSDARRWDSGRKLFASKSSPDLMGYCGEAFFPSQVLGQATDLIDNGLLWQADVEPDERSRRLVDFIKSAAGRRHNAVEADFQIVHVARRGQSNASAFEVKTLKYQSFDSSWTSASVDMSAIGQNSAQVLAIGSGAAHLQAETDRWEQSDQGGTSRAVFGAFCDALKRGKDPLTGGQPQIVGLTRKGAGQVYGFSDGLSAYLYGSPIADPELRQLIEWRDDCFQRIDGQTLKLMSNAQRQVRPNMNW